MLYHFSSSNLHLFQFVKIEDDQLRVFHQVFKGATSIEIAGRRESGQLLFELVGFGFVAPLKRKADLGNLGFEVVALNCLDDLLQGAVPGDFGEMVKKCELLHDR